MFSQFKIKISTCDLLPEHVERENEIYYSGLSEQSSQNFKDKIFQFKLYMLI